MSDIIKSKDNIPVRFSEMGDGTYAEVVSQNQFSSGANILLTGKSLTSTGTSVATIVPNDPPTFKAASCVRVAVTAPGYVRIKDTEAAATSIDVLVMPEDSIVINTKNKRFISFISVSGTAIANIQAVNCETFDLFEYGLKFDFINQQYQINQ